MGRSCHDKHIESTVFLFFIAFELLMDNLLQLKVIIIGGSSVG